MSRELENKTINSPSIGINSANPSPVGKRIWAIAPNNEGAAVASYKLYPPSDDEGKPTAVTDDPDGLITLENGVNVSLWVFNGYAEEIVVTEGSEFVGFYLP